jgi:hypothetical protein
MAEAGFKLPGDSYDQVVRILRGYAACKEPVGPAEVAKKVATDQTVVSRNNAFFLSVGVLEGGNKKALTEPGRRLASALEHDLQEEVRSAWAVIVEESDFLQGIVSAVKIRSGMDSSALVSHIAYSAGVTKSPRSTSGARTIVEVLKAAGALEEEDGKLVYSRTRSEPRPGTSTGEPSAPRDEGAVVAHEDPMGRPGLPISIRINVNCSVDEVETLGSKLQNLLKSLRELPEGGVERE